MSERRLQLSRHVSIVTLGPAMHLCGHALRAGRDLLDDEGRARLEAFRVAQVVDDKADGKVRFWERSGFLVDAAVDEDEALVEMYGRSVETAKAAAQREQMRARDDRRVRLRVGPAPALPAEPRDRWTVVYLGLCLVLPSADVLAALAATEGCDVTVYASLAPDLDLVTERAPDFVVVGDLPRVGLGYRDDRIPPYIDAARTLLTELRRRTSAPILLRNLPGPSTPVRGMADRGKQGAINRVRLINVALAELALTFSDVHVVDIDHTLSVAGKRGLVDDAVVVSHHLASLTWIADRAAREPLPGTAHDVGALLAAASGRAPLELEHLLAAEDLRYMLALRGVGRRKLVVVDLDDTLWPGVLAETGAPFPPALAVDLYPHFLYLGLHEALLALRDRGILLACVSKNDEAVVRELWRYPEGLRGQPALTLDDFVTYRINWDDKVENVLAIAAELEVAPSAIAFIDDSARERENVRSRLPEVMVLGDNPFAVRAHLLTDPAFQVPSVTAEASRRTELVRGKLARDRARDAAPDAAAFAASLDMRVVIRREVDEGALPRIAELLQRTTQLTTTGEAPAAAVLRTRTLYTLTAADRFTDYGLAGVCVVEEGTDLAVIHQVAISCRILGVGLESFFVATVARDVLHRCGAASAPRVEGRWRATARNLPARNLYASAGFVLGEDGRWMASTLDPPTAPHITVTRENLR